MPTPHTHTSNTHKRGAHLFLAAKPLVVLLFREPLGHRTVELVQVHDRLEEAASLYRT